MALELGAFGITVNSICPAVIKTDMNRVQMEVHAVEAYNKLLARVPLGRFGNPEDLSGALLFFASDASAYVTGQDIYVDGGLGIT
jgi:NAD(P)-dependent dehydrogenase (short-subunit alcohol dehydrogenase family)